MFHDITQHRFLHYCSCDMKQVSVNNNQYFGRNLLFWYVGILTSGWLGTNVLDLHSLRLAFQQGSLWFRKTKGKCYRQVESRIRHCLSSTPFFSFGGTRIWTQGLGQCSTTLATAPTLYSFSCLLNRVSHFWPGPTLDCDLPTYATMSPGFLHRNELISIQLKSRGGFYWRNFLSCV
jgi:hypothetical protein